MSRNLSDLQGGDETVESKVTQAEERTSDSVTEETGGPAPKKKKKKVILITVLVLLIVAAGTFGYFYLVPTSSAFSQEEAAEIVDDGTYFAGLSILGVDLGGKTPDQARPEVEQAAQDLLADISEPYIIEGEEYALTGADMGAAIDVEPALAQALLFGREGGYFERQNAIVQAQQNGYAIETPVSYDESAIKSAVSSQAAELNVAAQDATVVMNKISDEDRKITGMDIEFADGVTGLEVNADKLAADIFAGVQAGNFDAVTAETLVTEPEMTLEEIQALYTERGTYQTTYSGSAEGRRYNIWKMADIINGVEILPGETWSINEEAGPRTYANGWKAAPGISEGVYKDEPGGGICQTNSTLYNAVIRAELEIVEKTPHSWPLDYVPGGLDATISTGGPHFIIKNNQDVPIYIIAECDGEDARNIRVSIYGPAYEDGLTRDFTSEKIDEWGAGGPQYINDPSMPAGTQHQDIGAHNGKTFRVTKHYLDADGNEVRSEHYEDVTYSAKAAKIRVGTGAAATPTPDPGAAATPEPAAPTPEPAAPTPEPVAPAPEPSTEAPAATPDPGAIPTASADPNAPVA